MFNKNGGIHQETSKRMVKESSCIKPRKHQFRLEEDNRMFQEGYLIRLFDHY